MGDESITVELGPDSPALAPEHAQAPVESAAATPSPHDPSASPDASPPAPLTAAERLKSLIASDAELASEVEREANARASRRLDKQHQELEDARAKREEAEKQTAAWTEYEALVDQSESEDWDTRQKAIEALAANEKARRQQQRLLRNPELQAALMNDVTVRYFDSLRQAILSAEGLKGVPPEFVAQVWASEPDPGKALAAIAAKRYEGYLSPKDHEESVKHALATQRAQLMGEVPSPDVSRGTPVNESPTHSYDAYRRALQAGGDELEKWLKSPKDIDAAIAARFGRAV